MSNAKKISHLINSTYTPSDTTFYR